jgi:hypothetical protein
LEITDIAKLFKSGRVMYKNLRIQEEGLKFLNRAI